MSRTKLLENTIVGLSAIGMLQFGIVNHTIAQVSNIIPDDTLQGAERSQVIPDFLGLPIEAIDGGAIRGTNLFHSFREFNVSAGRSALLFEPGGIQNILVRVTGGNASQILGGLGTFNSNEFPSPANLFLLNPSGVIFGSNAQLLVGGSFVATTASGLQFGDRGVFSATNPAPPADVLTINPSAFLFNQIAARAIETQGSLLGVPDGRSLLLVGGDVQLKNGFLAARGGRIEFGGLAGSGSVGLAMDQSVFRLSFPEQVARSNVSLTGTGVTVESGGGGDFAIHANNVSVLGGTTISAGIQSGTGSAQAQAGDITIEATGTLTLAGFRLVPLPGGGSAPLGSVISNGVGGIGNAGQVQIRAGSVVIGDGTFITSTVSGEGRAGNVRIEANNSINLTGGEVTSDLLGGKGQGGDLFLQARSIFLSNESFIKGGTSGEGSGGAILLKASEQVALSGGSYIESGVLSTGIGDGGTITIETPTLSLTEGSVITGGVTGRGNGGNIFIKATGAVTLDQDSQMFTSVVSDLDGTTDFVGIGNSGNLRVEAGSLTLSNARLSTGTSGQGNAGKLSVDVQGALTLDASDINSLVLIGAKGDGGELLVEAGSLSLLNDSEIAATTFGEGKAGNLTIRVDDAIRMRALSRINSSVRPGGVGSAGVVEIEARSLDLASGAQVLSAVQGADAGFPGGQGAGGTLRIRATDSIRLAGITAEGFGSGFFVATGEGAIGDAGNIEVRTPRLSILDGARISAQSRNAGNAGNITLTGLSSLEMNNGSILASAAQAGGGDINIDARTVDLRDRSLINTSVAQSVGGGGDIRIEGDRFVALEDSDVLANANAGPGGNIRIAAPVFLADFFSSAQTNQARYTGDIAVFRNNDRVDINASSSVGISGSVTIPDFSFLQNSLASLEGNFVNPDQIVAGSCLARRNAEGDSFVVTGTGGLPVSPDDVQDLPYSLPERSRTGSLPQSRTLPTTPPPAISRPERSWKLGDSIEEAQSVTRTTNGRVMLISSGKGLSQADALICHPE